MQPKKKRILKISIILFFLGIIPLIAASTLFNPRFFFWLHFPLGQSITTGKSPDDLYDVYFKNSSFLGFSYSVYISRKYYQKPWRILGVSGEDEKVRKGPLAQELAVVWSEDNRYAAMIWHGWYVDYYDFQMKKRFTLELMLYGEVDAAKMSEYHEKVQEVMGPKTIQLNFDE